MIRGLEEQNVWEIIHVNAYIKPRRGKKLGENDGYLQISKGQAEDQADMFNVVPEEKRREEAGTSVGISGNISGL